MHQNLPLPFPVRDTSDLKRAIKYVSRAAVVNEQAQRYVISRARAFGHMDLIPTSWTKMTTTQYEVTLDEQIAQLATVNDISVAQLKTVYLRGVNDFLDSDITYGSATMYGLARVQRFIKERGAVVDSDLLGIENESSAADYGIELEAGSFFSPDVVYAAGTNVAALFEPGEVDSITITEHPHIVVTGTIDSLRWQYSLDGRSGEHFFVVL